MKNITIGSVDAATPGRHHGGLEIGGYPDGTPVETPVVVIRGEKDGPVLWMHACVHGNEYSGTCIIHGLLNSLDPAGLSGTVVALPALNLTAFQKNQRMSPFEYFGGGDLNRCFPGKPDGSVTEQMAYEIYGPLKKHADYFVDFHTAFTPDTRWAIYADYGGEVSEKSEQMARAFGYRDTLPAPADLLVGSALHRAGHDGIPSFIIEAGGIGPAFTQETVTDAVERLRNLMRQLAMLDGDVTPPGPMNYFSNFAWVSSTRAGLYTRAIACGDEVNAGQVIGHYHDVYGNETGVATSPHSGIALATHPGPAMARGETLIHIGLNRRSA